jgi:hypothetical protein
MKTLKSEFEVVGETSYLVLPGRVLEKYGIAGIHAPLF